MAHVDVNFVKNVQVQQDPNNPGPKNDESSSSNLRLGTTNSRNCLTRNNSTYSSKSHNSMRSGVLVKSAAESLNDSIVNPLSLKRLVSFNHQANLNSIDYTVINTTNAQSRQHDDASSTSTTNRSAYSFNRIANITSRHASLSNTDNTSNIVEVRDPVIIRGAGNITIFGVSNKFNEQFPSQLYSKLAPEEFRDTIKQINSILNRKLANSFRWLVFGSIFCCCTLGCSLFPVIFINKKARLSINKFLQIENQRLYLKLGLKWRLAKIKCNSNSLMEYVLLIEFLPTVMLYHPD